MTHAATTTSGQGHGAEPDPDPNQRVRHLFYHGDEVLWGHDALDICRAERSEEVGISTLRWQSLLLLRWSSLLSSDLDWLFGWLVGWFCCCMIYHAHKKVIQGLTACRSYISPRWAVQILEK